jgi:4'-phosphopantetheinyl transferase
MVAVRLWWVDLTRVRVTSDGLTALDPAEGRRASELTDPLLRRRFQAAHLALRHLLGEQLGIPPAQVRYRRERCPCGRPGGRPRIDGMPAAPEFSLSRSADLAAVAVSDRPVGVDLEARRSVEQVLPLADQPHPRDRTLLIGAPDRDAQLLLRWWVRAEAVLKCRGEGIRHGLDRFPVLQEPVAGGCLVVSPTAPPGYLAALAVAAEPVPPAIPSPPATTAEPAVTVSAWPR